MLPEDSHFINRELSWLSFNRRVLQEAEDPNVPLLERLKFLGIYANNLDEFFRIRVGTLTLLLDKKIYKSLGFDPSLVLKDINFIIKKQEFYFVRIFSKLKKELINHNIFFVNDNQLNEEQEIWLKNFFNENLKQFISPIILNSNNFFPPIDDSLIYLAIKLHLTDNKKKYLYSLIEIPTNIHSRFIIIPNSDPNKKIIILLEDIIRLNLNSIYKIFSFNKIEAFSIKITRNAELERDNDVSTSIIEKLSEGLRLRKIAKPLRFVVDRKISSDLLQEILKGSKINSKDVVFGNKYQNFHDFIKFPSFSDKKSLNYFKPSPIHNFKFEKENSLLNTILNKDVLLFFPFNSFDYLLNFLREASIDPLVTEIKMSLYRLATNSQITNILINAAKNAKKVTVVIEVTARFDENNNIFWANKMNEVGIKVIYGHPKLKVHCKIIHITKKIKNKKIHFSNISTGNFNEQTAKSYSDLSLFTSNQEISKEINMVFQYLEGDKIDDFKTLLISPFNMRETIIKNIENEILCQKKGKETLIVLKSNSIIDEEIINKLYEASNCGVKIKLIVRGICCLVPNIKNLSENISAISIIDKYLEHSRIYYFKNAKTNKLFISSADLMPRNIDYRIEVGVPILDKQIQNKIKKFLTIQLKDNVKARIHDLNMSNIKNQNIKPEYRSQIEFYKYLESIYLKEIEENNK